MFKLSTPIKSTKVVTILFVGSIDDSLLDDVESLSDSTCKSLNFLNPAVWLRDPTISSHSLTWTLDLIAYEKAW